MSQHTIRPPQILGASVAPPAVSARAPAGPRGADQVYRAIATARGALGGQSSQDTVAASTRLLWLEDGLRRLLAGRDVLPADARYDAVLTHSIALVGGGYAALRLREAGHVAEIVRAFAPHAAVMCQGLARAHGALRFIAAALHNASVPGQPMQQPSGFALCIAPALMAAALYGGPSGLAAAAACLRTLSPYEEPEETQLRVQEAHSAQIGDGRRRHERWAAMAPAKAQQALLRPVAIQLPRTEPASVPPQGTAGPQAGPPHGHVAAAARLGDVPPSQPSMPPPSATALGKRPAAREPAVPPRPARAAAGSPSPASPRAAPVAAAAASAGAASFAWSRNGVALVSGPELFDALLLGAPSAAEGARFSARIGTLVLRDAPLALIAEATASGGAAEDVHAARTLPFNGWTLRCTPAELLQLLPADGPRRDDADLSVQLEGLDVAGHASQLRALLCRPPLPPGFPIALWVNGRHIACSLGVLVALIGPQSAAASPTPSPSGAGAPVAVRLEGNALNAPATLIRDLLHTPRQGA